jgi:threonylcarbamoyladenosine tRNA methylthiotransferase MtaB
MMQRIAITTLGCKTNQFESAAMAEVLGKDGFQVVSFDEPADIYIINTCTVTARTDAESRQLIRRAARRRPGARIVVTGCYAQLAYDNLRDMPEINLVLGNTEKRDIASLVRGMGGGKQILVSDIAAEREAEGLNLESFAEHTRAFLQIQNGCDSFCSYCIVPHARGRSRSVPFAEVLEGVKTFAGRGFREVVLTGIHLGGYGLDLNPRMELLDLLKAVEGECMVERLRLGSIEPMEISIEMIRFLWASKIVCPHLHIPLQSGNDAILERMNRRYTTAFFREVIDGLVEAIPEISIGCDVIAGFPGEAEEEFQESYHFIESLPIAYLHVFPFSPRPGTPAATMAGQVGSGQIKKRAALLRGLGERKRAAYFRGFIGKDVKALGQEMEGNRMVKGLSRNYIQVLFPGDRSMVNVEKTVRITGADNKRLFGEILHTS